MNTEFRKLPKITNQELLSAVNHLHILLFFGIENKNKKQTPNTLDRIETEITFWKGLLCTKTCTHLSFQETTAAKLKTCCLVFDYKHFASKTHSMRRPVTICFNHSQPLFKISACHYTHPSANKCVTHPRLVIFEGPVLPEKNSTSINKFININIIQVNFRCIVK